MNTPKTIIEGLIVPHAAFVEAQQQLELFFKYAAEKAEAEGLAILGESGTGKTSVLDSFAALHPRRRTASGIECPILRATVPSAPTVKSLAGVLLAAIGAEDHGKGTEHELTSRLKKLIVETGTRMVVIDEFQHFIDRNKRKIMREVADWLKVLIDDTRTTLVVAGLPACRLVIDENEQLARRFSAAIELPRFTWQTPTQRKQFGGIVISFDEELRKKYDLPSLRNDEMLSHLYGASGGLIGYLVKILVQTVRTAEVTKSRTIHLADFANAYRRALWSRQWPQGTPAPFDPKFRLDKATLQIVGTIGKPVEPEQIAPRRLRPRREAGFTDSMLSVS
jgi:energy-coupling factor transporter ATP-binding protein EcfA2